MLRTLWNALFRRVRLLLVLAAVSVLATMAWSVVVETSPNGVYSVAGSARTSAGSDPSEQAWADALLAGIDRHVLPVLPIRVANACGLGASSCFRCHNGKRAMAPGADPGKSPWHREHTTVNNSCAGCHQGNPRLMKKKIAHSKLVADPRKQPADSCFNCHASGDGQQLVERYQQLSGKGE